MDFADRNGIVVIDESAGNQGHCKFNLSKAYTELCLFKSRPSLQYLVELERVPDWARRPGPKVKLAFNKLNAWIIPGLNFLKGTMRLDVQNLNKNDFSCGRLSEF